MLDVEISETAKPRVAGAGARPIFSSDFFLECDGMVTAINQDVDHQVYPHHPCGSGWERQAGYRQVYFWEQENQACLREAM